MVILQGPGCTCTYDNYFFLEIDFVVYLVNDQELSKPVSNTTTYKRINVSLRISRLYLHCLYEIIKIIDNYIFVNTFLQGS